MEKILLIEDNQKHIADAMVLLEGRVKVGAIDGFDHASTLDGAMKMLQQEKYNGIISDVFFPTSEGEAERLNGTNVGQYALEKGIPIVLITSTNHHGRKTQPACDWARERCMELIDSEVKGTSNGNDLEASEKNWFGAYVALAYLMHGKNIGIIQVTPNGHLETTIGFRSEIHSDCGMNPIFYGKKENWPREFLETNPPYIIESWERKIERIKAGTGKFCEGMF